jgi:ABC-type sugar transport system ATPase subunit
MAEIRLEGVRKTFGDVVAVDGVDLAIPDGSFTVLLGPSGCGKTTTLNMIAGLESASAGRILFDGEEVQDLPPNERDIAMVFQSYALYPNRTVRQNIAFPLKMRRASKEHIAERVGRVAAKLGIEALLERYPRQLSGGQQQRVAVARAIVRDPTAFMLDEPLSNLDAKLRADMRFELKALQEELGGTFVYVTHDQAEAMSLADQVVVMADGTVQQIGQPREIYWGPINLFVARFVGVPEMNLFDGEVVADRFVTNGWSCPVPADVRPGAAVLGVRSEDVTISPADSGADGTIRLVELTGADVLIDIEATPGRFVVRAPAQTPVDAGGGVAIEVDPRAVHLFDPSSGERISPAAFPTAPEVPFDACT